MKHYVSEGCGGGSSADKTHFRCLTPAVSGQSEQREPPVRCTERLACLAPAQGSLAKQCVIKIVAVENMAPLDSEKDKLA